MALIYIHGKEIINLNINPENLYFDEKGYLRLSGFGHSILYGTKEFQFQFC